VARHFSFTFPLNEIRNLHSGMNILNMLMSGKESASEIERWLAVMT